jgi:regulator of replication initiation timing
MKSVGQLLEENERIKLENYNLRVEIQKLRSNQPQYFREDGMDWWFRKKDAVLTDDNSGNAEEKK